MRLYKYLAALALGAALSVPANAEANQIGRSRTFGLGVVAGYPGFGASLNILCNQGRSLPRLTPQPLVPCTHN